MLLLIKHMASQQQARTCRLACPATLQEAWLPKPWWCNICHGVCSPEQC